MSLIHQATEALEHQLDLFQAYGRRAVGAETDIVTVFPAETARQIAKALIDAQPIYVSRDIATGLVEALSSLPLNIPLHPEDLPTPTGFVWLGGQFRWDYAPSILGYPREARALLWRHLPEHNLVEMSTFGIVRDEEMARWSLDKPGWLHTTRWTIGTPIDAPVDPAMYGWGESDEVVTVMTGKGERREVRGSAARGWAQSEAIALRSMAYSIWHFMSQRVVTRARVTPDRAMRRRWPGLDNLTNPVVTVVQFRVADSHNPAETHHEGRQIRVRHVVRGHWRRVWVGPRSDPSERRQVPVWVQAFVRGPEGGPLRNPQKIFVVSR